MKPLQSKNEQQLIKKLSKSFFPNTFRKNWGYVLLRDGVFTITKSMTTTSFPNGKSIIL